MYVPSRSGSTRLRSNNNFALSDLALRMSSVRSCGSCLNTLLILLAMHALFILHSNTLVQQSSQEMIRLPQMQQPNIERSRPEQDLDTEQNQSQLQEQNVSLGPSRSSYSQHNDTNVSDGIAIVEPQESISVVIDGEKKLISIQQTTNLTEATATTVGMKSFYYADFERQRADPNFRSVPLPGEDYWEELVTKLSKEFPRNHIWKPCNYFENGRRMIRSECLPTKHGPLPAFVAFNSHENLSRTWCNQQIPPLTFVYLDHGCLDPVKIYPFDSPPISGEGMPPVRIRMASNPEGTVQKLDKCSVPCEVGTRRCASINTTANSGQDAETIDCLPLTTDWIIGASNGRHSWNFKIYRDEIQRKFDRTAYRNFNFCAARSRNADVPLSVFRWDQDGNYVPSPALDYGVADKSISFLDKTLCQDHPNISSWLKSFQNQIKVASYGNCMSTEKLPQTLSLENDSDRTTLIRKHLFHLVPDRTFSNEIAASVIWEALDAGVIPIYLGPHNVSQYVPQNSIISVSTMDTQEEIAGLIMEIAANKTKWEQFHAWRIDSLPKDLIQRLQAIPTDALMCRICMWAHSKRYGLAWNHKYQRTEAPTIPRDKLCFSSSSDNAFLHNPVRESWVIASSSPVPKEIVLTGTAPPECNAHVNLTQTFKLEDLCSVTRTVSHHDSIVDFIIPQMESKNVLVTLRLKIPIDNFEGAYFRNVHQMIPSNHTSMYSSLAIQDRRSRMTVLSNWPALMRSPTTGIVHIEMQTVYEASLRNNEIRRVRIVLEDISSLRDVKTEYVVTPFAEPLIQDFLDPLELFYLSTPQHSK